MKLRSARADSLRHTAAAVEKAKIKKQVKIKQLVQKAKSLTAKTTPRLTQTSPDPGVWMAYVADWTTAARKNLEARGRSEIQIVAIGKRLCGDAASSMVKERSGTDQATRKRSRIAREEMKEIVGALDFDDLSNADFTTAQLFNMIGEDHPVLDKVSLFSFSKTKQKNKQTHKKKIYNNNNNNLCFLFCLFLILFL